MKLRKLFTLHALKSIAIWLGWMLLMLFIGVVIETAPYKVSAVMIVGSGAIGVTFFAWAYRSKLNAAPGKLIFLFLMMTVALSVLWPRYIFVSLGIGVNPLTLSTMAGVGFAVLFYLYSPSFSKRLGVAWEMLGSLRWFILAWFIWCLLANFGGERPIPSIGAYLRESIYISSFCLIGAFIATFEHGAKWTLRVLVFATLMVSGIGVLEALMHKNLFARFASAGDSKDVSDAVAGITADKMRGGSFRIQSTFDHPIVCAQYFGALMPILYYFIRFESSRFWRLVAWLAVPLSLVATIKTGSRAGLVSLAVAGAVVGSVIWLRAVARGRMSRMIAVVSLPAILIAAVVGYWVMKEYALGRSGAEYGSTQVRVQMLYTGISVLTDSPIWGFGSGMAVFKAGVINPEGLATIDNYYLSIALNFGYVGLILLVSIIGMYVWQGIAASVKLNDQEGMLVGAYTASIMALAAAFAILSIPNNMTLFWLIVTTSAPLIRKAQLLKREPHIKSVPAKGMRLA